MGVTSIRFNQEEEKLLKTLKDYYNSDSSTIIKRSLREMYDDIQDFEIVNQFEKNEKDGKTGFLTFDELIK